MQKGSRKRQIDKLANLLTTSFLKTGKVSSREA